MSNKGGWRGSIGDNDGGRRRQQGFFIHRWVATAIAHWWGLVRGGGGGRRQPQGQLTIGGLQHASKVQLVAVVVVVNVDQQRSVANEWGWSGNNGLWGPMSVSGGGKLWDIEDGQWQVTERQWWRAAVLTLHTPTNLFKILLNCVNSKYTTNHNIKAFQIHYKYCVVVF